MHGDAVSVAAPSIDTGNFFWTTTDDKMMNPTTGIKAVAPPQRLMAANNLVQTTQPTAAKHVSLPASAGALTLLEGKTFSGAGFNTIFRPRSQSPLQPAVPGTNDNVLQLNLTQENLTFSASIGDIPNRGFSSQPDITLHGISYIQTVQDVTNPKTGSNDGPAAGIHFEPGMWIAVPACAKSPIQGPTLCRMASIPHGTTINAQGAAPNIGQPTKGKPTIPPVDITPFLTGQPQSKEPFPSQKINTKGQPPSTDRLPADLSLFNRMLHSTTTFAPKANKSQKPEPSPRPYCQTQTLFCETQFNTRTSPVLFESTSTRWMPH